MLKDQIDKALTADEIQRIKDKAELLNKIEVLKKVITPDDYRLANNQEVKKIIDETISNLKKSIDGIEKDKVIDKKNELDALKDKLTELKTEVENLSNNDVLELEKTRVELAKKLAKATDDEDINNTKLYIQKAKLKKKASN
ncbi:hypothetical protein [Mycoplasmopsis cynos]|uniref:hypothetical protein n=1 Tax=Mycoplasmopsis cynos TaxID=171284 RepID=UPI003A5C7DD1